MTETVIMTSTEIRNSLSDTVLRVAYGGERVTITVNKKPRAVMISVDDYKLLLKAKAQGVE